MMDNNKDNEKIHKTILPDGRTVFIEIKLKENVDTSVYELQRQVYEEVMRLC